MKPFIFGVSRILPVLGLAALIFSGERTAFADSLQAGNFEADEIFVHPVTGPAALDSFRAEVSVSAFTVNTTSVRLEVLPADLMTSIAVGNGAMALTRAKATALRLAFSYLVPVDLLTVYRDLDQGIDKGLDVVGFRVPISLGKDGSIVVQPGLELGVRHYVAPIDQTSTHASFVLEARAATNLVQDWLSTGVMGQVRYDAESVSQMSGFAEKGMAYLSLLLDRNQNIYARIYAGIDHQESRAEVGQPTTDLFGGVGVQGQFWGQ